MSSRVGRGLEFWLSERLGGWNGRRRRDDMDFISVLLFFCPLFRTPPLSSTTYSSSFLFIPPFLHLTDLFVCL